MERELPYQKGSDGPQGPRLYFGEMSLDDDGNVVLTGPTRSVDGEMTVADVYMFRTDQTKRSAKSPVVSAGVLVDILEDGPVEVVMYRHIPDSLVPKEQFMFRYIHADTGEEVVVSFR